MRIFPKKSAVFAALTLAANIVAATPVNETQIGAAANAFISSDPIGSAILGARSVDNIVYSDGIWIVSLSPQGHIIFSGSDLREPVIGFSEKRFSFPVQDSPAFAMLEALRRDIRACEESGLGERNKKWDELLSSKKRFVAKGASSPPEGSMVVVDPLVQAHFNQNVPFNDYCPVYDGSDNRYRTHPYLRGRCPAGCVATAAAQFLHYFRWPRRIDYSYLFNHTFYDAEGNEKIFPIRFDGRLPIDWANIENEYINEIEEKGEFQVSETNPNIYWIPWTDLRGFVAESIRYPVARLMLWLDILAEMKFAPDDSYSSYDDLAENLLDWYTKGVWVDIDDEWVYYDIMDGFPVIVTLIIEEAENPNDSLYHQVVGDGWATANEGEENEENFIHLNYGWSGEGDTYVNINSSIFAKEGVYAGCYPRAKPQLDPLPAVSSTDLTLSWHFPDIYTNNLSGFIIEVAKFSSTPTIFFDDFSNSQGVSDAEDGSINNGNDDKLLVQEDSDYGEGRGKLLYAEAFATGTYTFPNEYMLTSSSVLTFKLRSLYACTYDKYEIQASFNGGDWQTIISPALTDFGDSGWSTERAYLGDHGGQRAKFRLNVGYLWEEDSYDITRVLLDDFKISDVLETQVTKIEIDDKTKRSYEITGLDSGALYAFSVEPIISQALVDGEKSDLRRTITEGERITPLPGEQTYSTQNLEFSVDDTSGFWSYLGNPTDKSSDLQIVWEGAIACSLPGALTQDSKMTFSWTANEYYGIYNDAESYDVFSALLQLEDGTKREIWNITNNEVKDTKQEVSLDLSEYAGEKGKITLSYYHVAGGYGTGCIFYSPKITNVLVPTVPEVKWQSENLTALGEPQIVSITSTDEGFYRECGLDTTELKVVCSSSVTSLKAYPSHLALVKDSDVTIASQGDGVFKVSITPSGVSEENANERSRMILTLEATDAAGTKVYKDLSLRFAKIEAIAVIAESSTGAELTATIPLTWFIETGLAEEGASIEDIQDQSLDTADSDSDGQPNWFEYVCGTNPNNAEDKLVCNLEVVNNQAKVTYSPAAPRGGYKAVLKGCDDLRSQNWETVETTPSPLHFFKVVIEMAD